MPPNNNRPRSRAQEERIREQINNNVPVPAIAFKIVTQESQPPTPNIFLPPRIGI